MFCQVKPFNLRGFTLYLQCGCQATGIRYLSRFLFSFVKDYWIWRLRQSARSWFSTWLSVNNSFQARNFQKGSESGYRSLNLDSPFSLPFPLSLLKLKTKSYRPETSTASLQIRQLEIDKRLRFFFLLKKLDSGHELNEIASGIQSPLLISWGIKVHFNSL